MTKKIEIAQMTMEELIAYAEKVKHSNRERVKKHYNNTIKTDPEKYDLWKQKCNAANKRQYNKKVENRPVQIS